MGNTPSTTSDVTIDLSEPWDAPARLLEALASFDRLVEQIDGAAVGKRAAQTLDEDRA